MFCVSIFGEFYFILSLASEDILTSYFGVVLIGFPPNEQLMRGAKGIKVNSVIPKI